MVADLGRQDQQATDLAVRQRCHELASIRRALQGVNNHAHEPLAAQLDLDAGNERPEQRIAEIGHDHADKIRLLRAQRGGDGVRQVTELVGHLLDAPARRLGYLPPMPRSARDTDAGVDTGLAGNIGDRDVAASGRFGTR